MKTFLFLDDDAFHEDRIRDIDVYYPLIKADVILQIALESEVTKVTTVEAAISHIQKYGCPDFISFDNDLRTQKEGIDLAKWLVEEDLNSPGFIGEGFKFFVHSQNVIAKERIYSLLNQHLDMRVLPNHKTPEALSSGEYLAKRYADPVKAEKIEVAKSRLQKPQ